MLTSRIPTVFLLTSISVFVLDICPLLGQSPGPATVTLCLPGH